MKIVTVNARNQKIGPRKARPIMNLIKGKSVEESISILNYLDKKGSSLVLHLVKSAVDAAKKKDFNQENLYISESICQEGRKLKRHYIKARGRSTVYMKRSSHLKISLSEIKRNKEKKEVKYGTKS
jgi:large subunit ribosomal protein L22